MATVLSGVLLRALNLCAATLMATLSLGVGTAGASNLGSPWTVPDQLGNPISQRFVARDVAIVSTRDEKVCVASQRIRIEDSAYLTQTGDAVPFDEIVRSPATSIQAVADGEGTRGFRIQMKFSPAPAKGIFLTLRGTRHDVTSALEPSTDSLWLTGALAEEMTAAFADGETPVLESTSRDTDHAVTDRIDAPDFAALTECTAMLATDRETAAPSNLIRLSFNADARTAPLATLPQLQACRMTDPPGELHLANISSNQGFYAQSDKVFVSFDDNGGIKQIYLPGIFDGDFRDGATSVRVSKASDANLPTETNRVSGCIGSTAMELCPYRQSDGSYLIAACVPDEQVASMSETPDFTSVPSFPVAYYPTPIGTGSSTPSTRVAGHDEPEYWPTGGTTGTDVPDTHTPPDTQETPEIPAVPLPSAFYLLGLAMAVLVGLRRRA